MAAVNLKSADDAPAAEAGEPASDETAEPQGE
jgi:hypothetical protein